MKQRPALPTICPRHADQRGFSIVLTLLVIVMMTVLVVGFNAATRTEQMAARNFNYQEQANQLAILAVNKGLELLNTKASATSVSNTATQPGRLFSPSAKAVPLTSAFFGGSKTTNLNTWQNFVYSGSTYTNYFISTNQDPAAFSVPLVEVKSGTSLIGRYGFWVDDDGSRLNLNAAGPAARADFLPTNSRSLAWSNTIFPNVTTTMRTDFGSWIQPVNAADAGNAWGWFFTPRQLSGISNLGTATYNSMMFQVGGGPLNWRPTNTYALGSNGMATALDAAGDFLQPFGSYTSSLASLNSALDAAAGKLFRGSAYGTYFEQADGFAAKYGAKGLKQIIANINDATKSGASGAFTGANTPDMLTGTNTSGTNTAVPSTLLALRPSLLMNEVAIGAAYSTNAPAVKAEVQVWMTCELIDPYKTLQGSGYELRYKIASLKFNGTYMLDGSPVPFSNPPLSTNWNYDGGQGVTALGTVGPNEYKIPPNAFVFEWQCGNPGAAVPSIPPNASNIVINSVTVRPAVAILRSLVNTATTVRDWAVGSDFPASGFAISNVAFNSQAFGYLGAKPAAAPVSRFTDSIEKNDPRVRRFGTNSMPVPAWTQRSGHTLGSENKSVNFSAGTGISGVANDRPGSAKTVYDHPSFDTNATNFLLGRSNWISAFDLSKIHTGLQWRTLQFRAQEDGESAAGLVPDWALLEAFAVTSPAVGASPDSYKVNVNSLVYPAASNTPSAANLISNGMARPQAVAALLSGFTTKNAPLAKIGTNSLGFPAAAGFADNTSFLRAATNITSLTFTNSWAKRRAKLPDVYQTNLCVLPAEVLEINEISNFSTDEAANEARAQGVYTGVAVASQVFTIYAAGFATDKQGNEVAESRVRAQVARDKDTGKFEIVYLEPLIWP